MVLWTRTASLQQLVGSVAIAVQRGSAMSWLEGYNRSRHVWLALMTQRWDSVAGGWRVDMFR